MIYTEKQTTVPITLESLDDKFETFYEYNFKKFQKDMLGFKRDTEDNYQITLDNFARLNDKVDDLQLHMKSVENRLDKIEQRLERIENAITGLLDLVKRHDGEIREIKAHLSI